MWHKVVSGAKEEEERSGKCKNKCGFYHHLVAEIAARPSKDLDAKILSTIFALRLCHWHPVYLYTNSLSIIDGPEEGSFFECFLLPSSENPMLWKHYKRLDNNGSIRIIANTTDNKLQFCKQ